jgi:hypothetical protein
LCGQRNLNPEGWTRFKLLLQGKSTADFVCRRRGHYGRALEEAIHIHSSQWPPAWKEKNPLHGGGSFTNMAPVERVRAPASGHIQNLTFAGHRLPF